mmetsp:Transcript_45619/g.68821  ORF Transcript_45619/g.68821 Transcript_45619/m.68821 type:complete len:111 (-) Transcript_45619:526-858(-)
MKLTNDNAFFFKHSTGHSRIFRIHPILLLCLNNSAVAYIVYEEKRIELCKFHPKQKMYHMRPYHKDRKVSNNGVSWCLCSLFFGGGVGCCVDDYYDIALFVYVRPYLVFY